MSNKLKFLKSSFLVFFNAFLKLCGLAFLLLILLNYAPSIRANAISIITAVGTVFIPIAIYNMQTKTEADRRAVETAKVEMEKENQKRIEEMEAKLEEMRKIQTSLEAKQKEMKKLQADVERTLEAIKKVKITNSNLDTSSKGTSLNLSNATIGDML